MKTQPLYTVPLVALFACCMLVVTPLVAETQPRASFFDDEPEIVVPRNMKAGHTYPLLVFLPPTNFTTRSLYERFQEDLPDGFIILLPPGAPSSEDYLPDFMSFVNWYDAMVQKQIKDACARWPVDKNSIVITGHSLGGDLGWALAAKNPGQFRGIIISGTRCSYPLKAAGIAAMKGRDFKSSMYIGDQDTEARTNGLKAAFSLLQKNGVASRMEILPNQGHWNVPSRVFLSALDWTLGGLPGGSGPVQVAANTPPPFSPGESDQEVTVATPAPARPSPKPGLEVSVSESSLQLADLQKRINAAAAKGTIRVDVPAGRRVVVPGAALKNLVQQSNQTKRLQVQALNDQGKFAYIWMFEGKAGLGKFGGSLPDTDYTLTFDSSRARAIDNCFGTLEHALYLNFATGADGRQSPALAMKSWLFVKPADEFVQNNDMQHINLYRYDPVQNIIMNVKNDLVYDDNGILAIPFTQGGWYYLCDRTMTSQED